MLGVHPYLSAAELQSRFSPLVRYLSSELERNVILRFGRSYEEHQQRIGEDQIDIAYIGPVGYVKMVDAYGDKPLLAQLEKAENQGLTGHIVVRHDSTIDMLEALRGQTFAFGDPSSTMSSVVPQALLQKAGIGLCDLGSYRHHRGHRNVAFAVLSGTADAGAVKGEVFETFQSRGLRSLAQLPAIGEHVFVARSDLPTELVEELREALEHVSEDPSGRFILQSLHPKAVNLASADQIDFSTLRQLLSFDGQTASRPCRD